MHTITLNVVAFNPKTGKVYNNGLFDNRSMQLGAPVPRIGENYLYQVWSLKVFDVQYAYHSDSIKVNLYVWMDENIANKVFSKR